MTNAVMHDFEDWIGKKQETEDEISLTLVRRCAAMCNIDPAFFRRGDDLPPHWYSLFFTPNALQERIGHDGHPRKGEFLPPIPLPRRMFVGREVEFIRPLVIGSPAHKVSEIASITPKEGRSGNLVFVQVRHTIFMDDQPALVEKQNVVYRQAPKAEDAMKASAGEAESRESAWAEEHTIDPVLLFRYSALTWNGHRVHYDADYARAEEGYPGCLMNGGLTLHLLITAAIARSHGRKLTSLAARMISPLYVGDTFSLRGGALAETIGGVQMEAFAVAPSGRTAAEVMLKFSDGK